MKYAVATFAQAKDLTPNMVPVSTAVTDPSWFHNFRDADHITTDDNGILCGFRAEKMTPAPHDHATCGKGQFEGKGCTHDPATCAYLREYREQLDSLDAEATLKSIENRIKDTGKTDFDTIVFLYLSSASHACSEGSVICAWLNGLGIECEEMK